MLVAGADARVGHVAGIVEAQRHLTVRSMLDGIGGTLPAIAAMRFALGSFFVLSGFHKLTNGERHKTFVETLRVVGIPYIGILQWVCSGSRVPWRPGRRGRISHTAGRPWPSGHLFGGSLDELSNVASYKPIDSADRVDDWLTIRK